VAVSGTNLAAAVVTIADINIPLLSNSTNDVIYFKYPSLPAGSYEVKILTATGFTNPPLITTTSVWITPTLSSNTGSLLGHIITVTSNGFPASKETNSVAEIKMNCNGATSILDLISLTPNIITFAMPPNSAQTCNINITCGNSFYQVMPYTYSSAATPSITITSIGNDNYAILKDAGTTYTSISFVYLDINGK
jgi:hypothetical protein